MKFASSQISGSALFAKMLKGVSKGLKPIAPEWLKLSLIIIKAIGFGQMPCQVLVILRVNDILTLHFALTQRKEITK